VPSPRVALSFRLDAKAIPYRRALREVGLDPVDITPGHPIDSLSGFTGLLLTGGEDVKEQPRDILEKALLADALRRDLPVFGICRGLQLMNHALGGELFQDIPNHKEGLHEIEVAPESTLARIARSTRYLVNSRHHQAIETPAPGLTILAHAPDGIAEAAEYAGPRFCLGVQWHPEDRFHESLHDRALFEAFAQSITNCRK
jgi:putative glutamine amidotransferase